MTDNHDSGHMTKLTMAFLQDQAMRQLESYLKRGRIFENTGAEELRGRWIDLFREMAELDNTHETERHDIEAELSLKKDEPPYDLVKAEFESFIQKVNESVEKSVRDPNRKEEAENNLLADLKAFVDGFDKPSN